MKFGDVLTYHCQCCGTCIYHMHESVDDGWVCANPNSDNYADWVENGDTCDEWEERE